MGASLLALAKSIYSYSIDCTKSSPFHKIKTRPTTNVTEFFISWTFVLLHFNKICKQPTFKVFQCSFSEAISIFFNRLKSSFFLV